MPESPSAATPYEVLGVSPSVSDDELRRAYRRLLRQTHPDVGGNAARFQAVQIAWERVGNPERRASYDRQRHIPGESAGGEHAPFEAPAARGRSTGSGPRARTYGHPGGHARQRYLQLIREWAGRGANVDDPYAPELVRSAPREIRHVLADALAEEYTAQLVSALGIGYTAWHDVDAGDRADKLDHVVLGPAGLFAILSEDWGSPVQLRKGELVGEGIPPEAEPLEDVKRSAKALSRALRVRFTALVVVLPDEALHDPVQLPARGRHPMIIAVPRSRLVQLLRDGLPGMPRGSFEKVFDLRSRLQNGIRFVAD
jgi:curved DNA-binding protein CbpA